MYFHRMCLTLLKSYIYQTLNFRDELIDTHLDEDAALWSAIGEMKEYLGCDGMSSDETDQGVFRRRYQNRSQAGEKSLAVGGDK